MYQQYIKGLYRVWNGCRLLHRVAAGDEKTTTLVEHDRLYYGYPKFRWIDNDMLSIDLGKVDSVGSTVHNVGSIRITYTYDRTDTGWW
jgi:hypothetical protein